MRKTRPPFEAEIAGLVSRCARWVRDRQAPVVLAEPPFSSTSNLKIVTRRGAPLREPRRRLPSPNLHAWPDAGVMSLRHPLLACVMEGEVDFRIGLTQRMARDAKLVAREHQAYVLQLAPGSLVVMPAGVPVPDGARLPHWERSALKNAHSRILWFSILDQGVLLNTCTTEAGRHHTSSSIFLLDTQLIVLADILINGMRHTAGRLEEAEQALLLALLAAIERDCGSHQGASSLHTRATIEETVELRDHNMRRALQYIDANLRQPLTVPEIAAQAFVSPTQLNRLFHAALGVSVKDYLTSRKMALAQTLLSQTEFSIRDISAAVGYTRQNYFSRVFAKTTRQTPAEYRRRAQTITGRP